MNEEICKLMDEEIKSQLEEMSSLKAGSDEKIKATESLSKLYKLRIDDERLDNELLKETMEKEALLTEQKKDRWFKTGIAAAEIGIPLIFYGIWMRRGFKFEETGTFTSQTFKGLINRFRPTKK